MTSFADLTLSVQVDVLQWIIAGVAEVLAIAGFLSDVMANDVEPGLKMERDKSLWDAEM